MTKPRTCLPHLRHYHRQDRAPRQCEDCLFQTRCIAQMPGKITSSELTFWISLAIFIACRSRSLKSGLDRSSLVVYSSSLNCVVTPNSCWFTANWSHEELPEFGPNVESSLVATGVGKGEAEPSGLQAWSSRSRGLRKGWEMSVSVRKAGEER